MELSLFLDPVNQMDTVVDPDSHDHREYRDRERSKRQIKESHRADRPDECQNDWSDRDEPDKC